MIPDGELPMGTDDAAGPDRPRDAEVSAPAVAIALAEAVPGSGGEEAVPSGSPEEAIDEVDRLLDAVEAALAALDDGSYGSCRRCGSAVELVRLADDPLAQDCEACASGAEPLRD
jgi:DnaK suppressor protein